MDSHTQIVRIGLGASQQTPPVDESNPLPVAVVGSDPDGNAASFEFDANGNLKTTATISGDVVVDAVTIDNDAAHPVPFTSAQLPASLGANTAANSLPVTLSTDGAFAVNFGAKADVVAPDDTGSYSHIALLKRVSARLTSLIELFPTSLGSNSGLKVEANGAKNTATVSRVAASATAVTLLAANANRRRVIIYNESTVSLRVKLGSAASATDYSYLLGAGDTYESPTDWVYTGIVTGIWDSATGAAQVTEI